MINDEILEDYLEILEDTKENMERFFENYVVPVSFNEEELIYRQGFIETIITQYTSILEEEKTMQIFFNLDQVCNKILDMKSLHVEAEQKDHAIFACLLIICKIDRPNNLSKLKEIAVEKDINLEVVYTIESFILNKLGWKIFLDTPQVLAIELTNLAIVNNNKKEKEEWVKHIMEEFSEIFNNIHYRYDTYNKYNQFIWTCVVLHYIFSKCFTQEAENLSTIISSIVKDKDNINKLTDCFELINEMNENDNFEEIDLQHQKDFETPTIQRKNGRNQTWRRKRNK